MLTSAALVLVLMRAAPPPPSPAPPAGRADQQQDAKPRKPDKPKPVFKLGDEHPEFDLGKGSRIELRARFAADRSGSDASTADPAEVSTIDLGKRRIGVSGEIRNAFEFQVEAELDDDDPWRDVYGDFKYFGFARVRGGKFKIPFSLDENTGASRLDFMYRSLAATHLAPGRDRGVMVHGRVAKERLRYEAGVFEHDGKNARTNNPAKVFGGQTLAARAAVEPLRNTKDAVGDLSFAVAYSRSDVPEGISGLRGQTVLQQSFFTGADYIVNGQRRRLGVEMAFLPGPASVKMEWMRVETERLGESVEDGDLSPIVGDGWYVSGTYALTGEKKSRVQRPRKPLFQGGFGAVEVGARIESLRFRSGVSGETPSTSPRADVIVGNRNQVTTLGVNWYINRFVKIQANFIREKLDDPAQGPLPSKASFNTKAIRFQFAL
ncbi:MAG TPA: porin [Vicinamibacterales bacterium]|nr:porin [Vicinamibacterales bacterium]